MGLHFFNFLNGSSFVKTSYFLVLLLFIKQCVSVFCIWEDENVRKLYPQDSVRFAIQKITLLRHVRIKNSFRNDDADMKENVVVASMLLELYLIGI